MKLNSDRVVLTVRLDGNLWAVEEEGRFFGHSGEKDVAKAFANKRAREVADGGRACQVRISGEHGFAI
jgi:hypothetical protein